VSLSSTYQDQADTLRRIIEALAGLPVRALVTLGLVMREDEVPRAENVVVVPTAPHHAVLPHAAAMITHCGHGSTLKALSHGVPLVCVPMGRDQNDTAVRVVERGAGVRVAMTASPAKIAAAVKKILADPRYGDGARRLARAIESGEGCCDPVAELEAIVRPSTSASAAA